MKKKKKERKGVHNRIEIETKTLFRICPFPQAPPFTQLGKARILNFSVLKTEKKKNFPDNRDRKIRSVKNKV